MHAALTGTVQLTEVSSGAVNDHPCELQRIQSQTTGSASWRSPWAACNAWLKPCLEPCRTEGDRVEPLALGVLPGRVIVTLLPFEIRGPRETAYSRSLLIGKYLRTKGTAGMTAHGL